MVQYKRAGFVCLNNRCIFHFYGCISFVIEYQCSGKMSLRNYSPMCYVLCEILKSGLSCDMYYISKLRFTYGAYILQIMIVLTAVII